MLDGLLQNISRISWLANENIVPKKGKEKKHSMWAVNATN